MKNEETQLSFGKRLRIVAVPGRVAFCPNFSADSAFRVNTASFLKDIDKSGNCGHDKNKIFIICIVFLFYSFDAPGFFIYQEINLPPESYIGMSMLTKRTFAKPNPPYKRLMPATLEVIREMSSSGLRLPSPVHLSAHLLPQDRFFSEITVKPYKRTTGRVAFSGKMYRL